MRLGMDCGCQAAGACECADEGRSQHLDITSPTGAAHSTDLIRSANFSNMIYDFYNKCNTRITNSYQKRL